MRTRHLDNSGLTKLTKELRLHADTLNDINLVGLSPGRLLERISALPPHTVVLFLLAPVSSSQPAIPVTTVLEAVASRFPTYCLHDHGFGHGVVGGVCTNTAEDEAKTGEIAARILSGEKASTIPVVPGTPYRPCVDWRQLGRWHIAQAAVPAGTVVLFRQPSVWDVYWKYILGASTLIVLQALLLLGLLWQRLRKRKAEAALLENEERLQVMADAAPALIWTSDTD